MDVRRKFGEHERCVRVARGTARATLASLASSWLQTRHNRRL